MNNKNRLLLAAALLAAACTSTSSPAPASPRATKPEAYQPGPPPSLTYGEWFIEPRTCTIRARAAEFSLTTDGIPERGILNLRALFIAPLVQPPTAEVSEILVPVPIEGASRGFNIVLAYDAENAAHMFKQDTYLIVRYQPMLSTIVLESSFGTRGLMHALANLAKVCS